MSTGQSRRRCAKWRYRTRVDALIALARIQRKDDYKRDKQEQRAYECSRCRGWHLTSRPKAA